MHLILKDSGKKSLVGFTGGDICLTVEGPSAVGRLAMPIVFIQRCRSERSEESLFPASN
jgi:hypothetical protein